MPAQRAHLFALKNEVDRTASFSTSAERGNFSRSAR
jgi:hypothetical protein